METRELKTLAKEHGLTPAQLAQIGAPTDGGFRIDYYHPITRKKTGMYRTRRSGVTGPGKYRQPDGTAPEAYYPPLADWKKLVAQLKMDEAKRWDKPSVLITEGEFKAAKACAEGFPCIGLGGVSSFASKAKGIEWLPSLDYFPWKDVPVYIAFDSDAVDNKMVLLAETRLGLRLVEREAELYILRLPKKADGTKCGLDDYLIEYGADSLKKLMDEAKRWDKDLPLHKLNAELVFVEQPGCVVRLDDGFVMGTQPFRLDLYSDRTHIEGDKTVPTARKWMQSPQRNKANGITFAPGGELFIPDPRRPSYRLLNMWRGWGAEPVQGDVTVYHQLMQRTFDRLPEEQRTFARQWFAYPLQHPGAKLHTAMVLIGKQGTGKSLVAKYHRLLYGEAGEEITQAQLDSAFNTWIKNKCFVQGEEVTVRESKRSVAELLKSWITGHTVTINEKYIPTYTLPNVANFCMTSNHEDALYLEDSDRRYFVVELEAPPMNAKEGAYFGKWIEEPQNRNALLYHLLEEVDCTGFQPGAHAPVTKAKQDMIEAGLSDIDSWVRELPTALLHPDSPIRRVRPLHTARELLLMYQGSRGGRCSVVSMGLALRKAGFQRAHDAQQVKVDGQLVTLWPTVKGLGPKQLELLIEGYRKDAVEATAKASERFAKLSGRSSEAPTKMVQ